MEPPFPGGQAVAAAGPRPEPRFPGSLPPIWNVPHGRNPNFTGRAELLAALYDSLHAGQATVLWQALRGLGGVGKTQLALEYAYRHAADYSVVWWVPSETSPSTVYGELSRELGLPEASASESEVRVQAVRRWLERHVGWLLVFDNAVEPEAVRPYLPQGGSGHVIITSRYWDWGEVANELGLEVFDRDTESVPFLLRRTGQADEAAAKRLADALGNLPLALAQAAAYIASTGTTLAEYTELFETRRAELWEDAAAPGDYPVPVGATWSLAMGEVRQEPGAAELLYLLAYFAPEPVSRDWLVEGAEHLPEPLGDLVQDQLAWNRIGRVFRRYGLVEVAEAGLLVHRLVQAVTRDRLAEAERQAAAAVRVVRAAYPADAYSPRDIGVWSKCVELLGHALVTIDHAEALAVEGEATTALLNRAEQYLHSQGRYEKALTLFQRALEVGEATLGADHLSMATVFNNTALLYRDLGNYEHAESLLVRAVHIGEMKLCANHPDVATRLHNLANVYQSQGRYNEAGLLLVRTLNIDEATLGADHPSMAIGLSSLANVYQLQGRYHEAEPLLQRALSIREEVLGGDHPDTAQSLNNLAALYQDQRRYDEAEPLYQRVLTITDVTLGPSHPHTQVCRSNYDRLLQQRNASS